ncbi:MAG: PKD domain-containing protein [Opitutales bacterium]
MRNILVLLLAGTLLPALASAQISVRSDDINSEASKQFFYHWNGFEIQWFGKQINLVGTNNDPGFPASGEAFTEPYAGNSFAYEITAVQDWNTTEALSRIGADTFTAYLDDDLTPAQVNRHGGNYPGFGVSSDLDAVSTSAYDRNDKLDNPGEALIIKFDLSGEMLMDNPDATFGPDANYRFENTGLNARAILTLENLLIEEWGDSGTPRMDIILYDASEGDINYQELDLDVQALGRIITGFGEIEDNDILVLAFPESSTVDTGIISNELWAMTFDLDFEPEPPADTSGIPTDIALLPQHQYQDLGDPSDDRGFINMWREIGEIATFRTEPGNDALRTVVMDFHRGYLLSEIRGTLEGGRRITHSIKGVTDPIPTESGLVEVHRHDRGIGAMHTAYSLVPDIRVNHPGDEYVDISNMLDIKLAGSSQSGIPDGYVSAQGSARSAYLPPYHYQSAVSGGYTNIYDIRCGEELSSFNEHGFGGIAVPVGNILLLAKIRAGERAIASYDVSDPNNPVLLDVMRDQDMRWRHQEGGAYEPAVYGHYFVIPLSLRGGTIGFVDFSDPGNLRMHHIISGTEGAQRYLQFQDHRMFAGTEVIDLTNLDGGITPTEHFFHSHKGEYMLPLGNLLICAENSEQGPSNLGAIFAFQEEPDVYRPTVAYHIPTKDATGQSVHTRIGLIVHDTLDLTTLTNDTLKLVEAGDPDETPISGTITYSDKDIITFTPDGELKPETQYRVIAEGFTDIVGNPIQGPLDMDGNPTDRFSFEFTTEGPGTLGYPEIVSVGVNDPQNLLSGETAEFFVNATPDNGEDPSTLEYRWDFGDGQGTEWIAGSDGTTAFHTYDDPGQYRVSVRVRSQNAQDLSRIASLEISVTTKPVGEDDFFPRFEAEDALGDSSHRIFEFDAVPGVYDIVFRIRGNRADLDQKQDVYLSYQKETEDGTKYFTYSKQIGALIVDNGNRRRDWRDFILPGYFTEATRYRIEVIDNPNFEERPALDYMQIRRASGSTLTYEAEVAADAGGSATAINGVLRQNEYTSASSWNAQWISGRYDMSWVVDLGALSGTMSAEIVGRSRVASSVERMHLYVNDVFVRELYSDDNSFQSYPFDLNLLPGENIIELRHDAELNSLVVDKLSIQVPEIIYEAPESLLPINSSQIVLKDSTRQVISVFPDNNKIAAINADTLAEEWVFSVSENPRSLAVDADGRIWVTAHKADTIDIIDPDNTANNAHIDLPYGAAPHDILFNKEGTLAYVSLYGTGEVIQIDAASRQIVGSVNVGEYPKALALNGENDQLLVTRFISGTTVGEIYAVAIDPATAAMSLRTVQTLQLDTTSDDGGVRGRGLPNYLESIVIHPQDDTAYIASQKVNIVAGKFREDSTINHDSTVRSILSLVDLSTDSEIFEKQIDLNNSSQPTAITFNKEGNLMFVAIQGNNEVAVFNTATRVRNADLPTGNAPQGLLLDEVTDRLFVKNFLGRSITVHDISAGIEVGDFTDTLEDEIFVIAEGNDILDDDVLAGKKIFFDASSEDMGLESYLSCASCHQHGGHDGVVWDFTQRGEGLRNTIPLTGRSGMEHGNVHWSGNFDEIQDFVLDMVKHQRGLGFVGGVENTHEPMSTTSNSPADPQHPLNLLAAYVESLGKETLMASPYRQADGALTQEALKGKRLFEGQLTLESGNTLSCMECHVPDTQYTSSRVLRTTGRGGQILRNVGTIKESSGQRLEDDLIGIDVPTLWGLHESAPYLHDGSAATIEAVFDQYVEGAAVGSDGAAHNLTDTGYDLTEEEFESLVAYLYQIDSRDIPAMNAQTWAHSWGQDIGLGGADFDGDLISNFAEYALGGDPTVNDATAIYAEIAFDEGSPYFSFNRRGNDDALSYTVEESPDLEVWAPYSTINQDTLPTVEIFEEVLVGIDDSVSEMFYRLNISSDDPGDGGITPDVEPSITSSALPNGRRTSVYSEQLVAEGGNPPLTWSLADGDLPPGVNLAKDGRLLGTLTDSGTYTFTARIIDSDGDEAFQEYTVDIASSFIGWTETFDYRERETEDTDLSDGVGWTALTGENPNPNRFSVQSNRFLVNATTGIFRTSPMNIHGLPVTISAFLESENVAVGSEYVEIRAIVDGVSTQIHRQTRSYPAGGFTFVETGITGSELIIEIEAKTNTSSRYYYFDDLSVTPEFSEWTETFDYLDGTMADLDELDGVTWTLTLDPAGASSGIAEVQNNRLRFRKALGTFRTSEIAIGGASVTVSALLEGTGNLENNDFIRITAIVDGVPQEIYYKSNDFPGNSFNFTSSELTGETLILEIESITSALDEFYYLDNLSVVNE